MEKLAFLFITRNEILTSRYWVDFFENIDENKYNIYILSDKDFNSNDKDFNKFFIKHDIDKSAGKTMSARIKLMKIASEDKLNKKFIFLSEDFIPIIDFETIYKYLLRNDNSCTAFGENSQNPNRGINFTHKNCDWHYIDKRHVEILLDNENDLNDFIIGNIGGEHFLSSLLNKYGKISEIDNINFFHEDWGGFNLHNSGLPCFDLNNTEYFIKKIKNLRNSFEKYNEGYTIDMYTTTLPFAFINNENKSMHISSSALFLRKILNNNLFETYKNII